MTFFIWKSVTNIYYFCSHLHMDLEVLRCMLPAFKVTWSEFVYRQSCADNSNAPWRMCLSIWELPFADPEAKTELLKQCKRNGYTFEMDPEKAAVESNTWGDATSIDARVRKYRGVSEIRADEVAQHVPQYTDPWSMRLELLIESLGISAYATGDVEWIHALVRIVLGIRTHHQTNSLLHRAVIVALQCWFRTAQSRTQRWMCALDFFPLFQYTRTSLCIHGLLCEDDLPRYTADVYNTYSTWRSRHSGAWVGALVN